MEQAMATPRTLEERDRKIKRSCALCKANAKHVSGVTVHADEELEPEEGRTGWAVL